MEKIIGFNLNKNIVESLSNDEIGCDDKFDEEEDEDKKDKEINMII